MRARAAASAGSWSGEKAEATSSGGKRRVNAALSDACTVNALLAFTALLALPHGSTDLSPAPAGQRLDDRQQFLRAADRQRIGGGGAQQSGRVLVDCVG